MSRLARTLSRGLLAHFGSLRATLAGLGLLAAVVLARPAWQPLALVIAALSLNLVAALVVRIEGQRVALQPGEAWQIAGGTLVYDGLRSWMGYRVAYDPTLPWLLAASLLAALALGLHYVQKFWWSGPVAVPQPGVTRGVLHG